MPERHTDLLQEPPRCSRRESRLGKAAGGRFGRWAPSAWWSSTCMRKPIVHFGPTTTPTGRIMASRSCLAGRTSHPKGQYRLDRTEGMGADGQQEGYFWVCEENGIRKTDNVPVDTQRNSRRLSEAAGKYLWSQTETPMVLLILPPLRRLSYADPKPMPDGVWERNQRLCVFWGVPEAPMDYGFALGRPANSLAKTVRRWKRRTRNFRPTTCRQVVIAFAVSLVIILLVAGLIAWLGQSVAAVWIGIIATVVSLVTGVIALRNAHRPKRAL